MSSPGLLPCLDLVLFACVWERVSVSGLIQASGDRDFRAVPRVEWYLVLELTGSHTLARLANNK